MFTVSKGTVEERSWHRHYEHISELNWKKLSWKGTFTTFNFVGAHEWKQAVDITLFQLPVEKSGPRGPLSGPQRSTYVRPATSSSVARGPYFADPCSRSIRFCCKVRPVNFSAWRRLQRRRWTCKTRFLLLFELKNEKTKKKNCATARVVSPEAQTRTNEAEITVL